MKRSGTGKKVIAVLAAIGMLTTGGYAVPKTAEDNEVTVGSYSIAPRWTKISAISPSISTSGKSICPEVYVLATSRTAKITGIMYLEKKSGTKWVQVTSWSLSGTGSVALSKTNSGMAGNEYRTRIAITVDGEKAEATSRSCTV